MQQHNVKSKLMNKHQKRKDLLSLKDDILMKKQTLNIDNPHD